MVADQRLAAWRAGFDDDEVEPQRKGRQRRPVGQRGPFEQAVAPDVEVAPLAMVDGLLGQPEVADNDPELQRLRKDPTGPYGPETCVQGYVWREAYTGDTICVSGETRARTYWENQGNPLGTP